MGCTPIIITDESGNVTARGVICSRGPRRRPRPCKCGRPSSLLCDGPKPTPTEQLSLFGGAR